MELENIYFPGTKCSIKTIFEGIKMLKFVKTLDISDNVIRSQEDEFGINNFLRLSPVLHRLKMSHLEYTFDPSPQTEAASVDVFSPNFFFFFPFFFRLTFPDTYKETSPCNSRLFNELSIY